MTKAEIIDKYSKIPIGKTNLNKEIYIDRILDEDGLLDFLYNVYGPRDERLKKAGLDFLEEYYGLQRVAKMVLLEKQEGVDYHFISEDEVIDWLKTIANFYG